jgi:hypothetical protein
MIRALFVSGGTIVRGGRYVPATNRRLPMGTTVNIKETQEIPVSENVKIVRDVTEAPKVEKVEVEKTVTVEKRTVSSD